MSTQEINNQCTGDEEGAETSKNLLTGVENLNESSNRLETLGKNINAASVYNSIADIKNALNKVYNLARKKDVQLPQLRAAIFLLMAPVNDRVRSITTFLEIYNLKQQFKTKRRKYKLRMRQALN